MAERPGSRSRLLITCLALLLACTVDAGAVGVALAESDQAFSAHYLHRAQVETELLTRVQALTSVQRAHGAAIGQAIAALNTNIMSLFTEEEALSVASARPLPPARIAQEILPALQAARSGVGVEIGAYGSAPHGSLAVYTRVTGLIASARRADRQLAAKIGTMRRSLLRPAFRKSVALQKGALQSTIAQMQSIAISLTNAWLLLADTAWAGSQPTTAQGLAYTTATIAVPAKGQGPTEDTVGVQPRVTDGGGKVLPDTGAYRLSGPARFRGVKVDRLIGTLTVGPGATAGRYTVTYTQGRAREQVAIQVVP